MFHFCLFCCTENVDNRVFHVLILFGIKQTTFLTTCQTLVLSTETLWNREPVQVFSEFLQLNKFNNITIFVSAKNEESIKRSLSFLSVTPFFG
jgi:hypothetical protein